MKKPHLKGLYAITDRTLAGDVGVPHQVEQALIGGARIIQYRDKGEDRQRRLQEVQSLLQLCRAHAALLIINDDLELAAAVAADGVHLGRDDPAISLARERLGPEAIIGVSCYNRLDLALGAQEQGADYVAFGRFFSSNTKPLAVQADAQLLRQARPLLQIPIVAIGGITPENGAPLLAAGADMLAVIHGLFGQPDIRAACDSFNTLFEQEGNRT
jgi:thiamine-phosphate pyrophosphorylase